MNDMQLRSTVYVKRWAPDSLFGLVADEEFFGQNKNEDVLFGPAMDEEPLFGPDEDEELLFSRVGNDGS